MSRRLLYLGLMSGTSLDGIDAALVEVDRDAGRLGARLVGFVSVPYEPEQRRALREALAGGAEELCRINVALGGWLAAAAQRLLDETGFVAADLAAVGSHGHTFWHEPPAAARPGATLQLGEPAAIAERLSVRVISDFRARDVAAGGHGAPLVPLVDQLLFTSPAGWRALQNIGGIANVSVLPPQGAEAEVIAFDTGPGVMVIDEVVTAVSRGAERFDVNGRRARRGRVGTEMLASLLANPYFRQRPPKSTGREAFGRSYATALIAEGRKLGLADDDLVATATALTAASIADAYRNLLPDDAMPAECIVSGGGARNPALMQMLAERLAPIPVSDLSVLGWDPDAKEAAAFALLAHLHEAGEPGNLPAVTGAAGRRRLGKATPP